MNDATMPEFGTPEWRRYWMRQPVNVIVTALQIAGQGMAREISSAVATEAEVARLNKIVDWLAEKHIRCAANGEQWYGPTISKDLNVAMYPSKGEAIAALVEAARLTVAESEVKG